MILLCMHNRVINMLDVCRVYAEAYDILFNATKTKCMFFNTTYTNLFDEDVQFMGSPIFLLINEFFLGFSISRDILNRDINSKLISIFCIDLYGCSLWNYGTN